MSLLLDARKKALQARSENGGDGNPSGLEHKAQEQPGKTSAETDPQTDTSFSYDRSRNAGKNLFSAKSPAAALMRAGDINRNLLLALGGTVLLLAGGAGYFWYLDSASSSQPSLRRPPAIIVPAPAQNNSLAGGTTSPASADSTQRAATSGHTPQLTGKLRHNKRVSPPQSGERIHVKPQQPEPPVLLINDAYLAYRNGKLDDAQQMYLEVMAKDAQNTDALLGLAAIAQHRGEDVSAMQYYMRVLSLDPRNDVANAGISTLNMTENSESRLKNLLREQRNSAALHFALGNIYASQSRWGEAQSAYLEAYSLDSKNPQLAFNLAVSLDHLGQSKLAAQYYQRALQLDTVGGNQPRGLDQAQISRRVKELAR